MMFEKFDPNPDEEGASEGMRGFFGPGHVDHSVRQAIQSCWMALPKEKRTVAEVENQMRRLFERALKDFRDDSQAFGFGEEETC